MRLKVKDVIDLTSSLYVTLETAVVLSNEMLSD